MNISKVFPFMEPLHQYFIFFITVSDEFVLWRLHSFSQSHLHIVCDVAFHFSNSNMQSFPFQTNKNNTVNGTENY
jgi:hypothetical protein